MESEDSDVMAEGESDFIAFPAGGRSRSEGPRRRLRGKTAVSEAQEVFTGRYFSQKTLRAGLDG